MNSVNYADLAAFQAFVQTYGAQILSKGVLEFDTAKHVAHMPGVKGRLTGQKMKKNGSLIRKFDATFTGYDSQRLSPVQYTVDHFKSEFNVVPSEFLYQSYLGWLTTNGFDPREFPFQRYFLEEHMKGMAEELEVAIWEGVNDPLVVAADAPIIQKMDGFGVRVGEAITAGNTPVVTGAITTANIISTLQNMYDRLGRAYKNRTAVAFLSIDHEQAYYKAKGTTLQYITDEWMSRYFSTARLELKFVSGLDANKVLITIPDNLVYNYDNITDQNKWFFKQEHYSLEGSVTLAAGTTIVWGEDDELVVNDQW